MENRYDVIVVGGGPSGLTAALYLARAKYRVLVLEKENFGGQITITSEIVNYPGVACVSGRELTEVMRGQAEDFGAQFALETVVAMELDGYVKYIRTERGKEYKAFGVVLAVGASPRKIGFVGEKQFQGRGVAYCATCDGEFFTGREVLVVGGGFAAVEEAIFLTKYASKVTICVRTENFTCAAGTVEQLKDYPSIQVRFFTEVTEVGGDGVVQYVKCKNVKTGEEQTIRAVDGGSIGVFVFVGYEPATKWLGNSVARNEQGYIVTDRTQKTNIDGVYAAGDVCVKELRQVVTAVADGAIAATGLERYVSQVRSELGLPKTEETMETHRRKKRETVQEKGKENSNGEAAFIDRSTREKLRDILSKFQENISIVAVLGNDSEAKDLQGFVQEWRGMSEKIEVQEENVEKGSSYIDLRKNGKSVGIRYYSVPGGHEFNSFVIALYNTAGPGQELEGELYERVQKLRSHHKLQVMTTLSCSNCPEVVMGTQKLAVLRENIEAEMYDIAKFPNLKEKYQIMAVPCLVVDGDTVYFGKRGLGEIVEIVEESERGNNRKDRHVTIE